MGKKKRKRVWLDDYATIEYKGKTVTYNQGVVNTWKWQRSIASGEASRQFDAIDMLLCGRADKVAESIGGSMQDMMDLALQIMEKVGGESKN